MNLLKNNFRLIVFIIILILVSSGIGVFATYNYLASDVKYTDDKSVADALNDLYANKNTLLWTNSNPSSEFSAQKINLDLSNYTAIIILGKKNTTDDVKTYSYIEIGKSGILRIYADEGTYYVERNINVLSDGVEIGGGLNSITGSDIKNVRAIPTYIFGIK